MKSASSLLDLLGAPARPATLSRSALVIVDAQREYLDGALPLCGIDDALLELKKLLEKARSKSVPVFHVVHHTQNGAPIFAPDGPYVEIIDAVRPMDGEAVIKKHLPSSFVNTELDKLVKAKGKTELVIAGFMTHMCINATTRSAVDLGYSPSIVASACATRDLPAMDGTVVPAAIVHQSNLASLADLLACICKTGDELI
ncbi:MAG: cysteine hydrolase [Candidatus Obscuribacterales bacterium]|nr:cysteine hydrolase [Candidatus Obscuribacterales bacterium]